MNSWQRIQSLMEKTGISSRELAKIAGVVPSAVTKWKAGSSIRNAALSRIAIHFGVSTDWLVTGRNGVSHRRETSGATYAGRPVESPHVREDGNPDIPLPSEWDMPTSMSRIDARLANIERLLVKIAGDNP